MDTTLTLGQACMLVIVFLLIILLLYLISLFKNLIPSVKSLAKIMKDVEVITKAAARSTEKAEVIVSDVTDITSSVISSFKAQASLIGQASSIATAVKLIVDLISAKAKNQDDEMVSEEDEDFSEREKSRP